jgi:hypothetical protein
MMNPPKPRVAPVVAVDFAMIVAIGAMPPMMNRMGTTFARNAKNELFEQNHRVFHLHGRLDFGRLSVKVTRVGGGDI